MSRPFYLATPADPDGVRVRRHVRTGNREVRKVTDEVLDGSIAQAESDGTPDGTVTLGDVVNESALVAALNAARTGEMTDIVETIQREQDLIIRSSHRGVSVVQGGPGTGKTAVALHRAAYLLYTHRDLLARSGVLIIGPNTEFLRYISQVLPPSARPACCSRPSAICCPAWTPTSSTRQRRGPQGLHQHSRRPSRHVRTYQSLPHTGDRPFRRLPAGHRLRAGQERAARARSTRKAHNQAQREFLRSALHGLATAYAKRIGSSLLDGTQMLSGSDIADIRDEMRDDEISCAHCWPSGPVLSRNASSTTCSPHRRRSAR